MKPAAGSGGDISAKVVGLLLTMALAACTATAPNAPSAAQPAPDAASAEIVRQLIAQADAWDKAIVRKDEAAVEANVGRLFFHIGGDGSTAGRHEFIADLLDPKLTIEPYVVEGLTVRLFGDTALLSGTIRMTGSYAGKPFDSHYRYIDTYVREGGRWKVVAVQITRIAP